MQCNLISTTVDIHFSDMEMEVAPIPPILLLFVLKCILIALIKHRKMFFFTDGLRTTYLY